MVGDQDCDLIKMLNDKTNTSLLHLLTLMVHPLEKLETKVVVV